MTPELVTTLCEYTARNYRTLVTMASDLLVIGVQREVMQLDGKLFFDTYTPTKAEAAGPRHRRHKASGDEPPDAAGASSR